MMKSYVKFLSRNKLYATIEALGLSVALAFVLILVSYATAEYRVGTNQKLAKELYVAGSGDYLGMTWGIAKEFFPSIPEIKGWTRFGEYYAPQGAMIDGQYYEAKYLAIDPNFSQFMGYKCRGYAPDHLLSDAHQAMVSESFAKKAFGNANPIGRTIQCGKLQLKVVGIMEDFDREDLLNPYDIFVSMKLIEAEAQPMNQFGSCTTVARLAKEADPEKVRQTLLGKYINYWKEWKKESGGSDFMWGCQFVRWDQIHFADDDVEIFKHGNRSLVNILLVVALVLLLSALFNYINLTVAQIGNRAKEMATRRLLGESVGGVMLRYLKESALFTAVCFLLGIYPVVQFYVGYENRPVPFLRPSVVPAVGLRHHFHLCGNPSCHRGFPFQPDRCGEGNHPHAQQDVVQQDIYRSPERHQYHAGSHGDNDDAPDEASCRFAVGLSDEGYCFHHFFLGWFAGEDVYSQKPSESAS